MIPRTPEKVNIAVTGKCNLSCQYCFFAGEMSGLKDLATAEWSDIISKLGNLKVMGVTLSGGEAFTRPDIFEIIDEVILNKMRYRILSNGTLIDNRTIERLNTGKRRIRLEHIQISLDGSCAEIHNRTRPDSFAGAIRALQLLNDAGIPLEVRVTINKHNIGDLENIAKLLLEDIGIQSFATNEAIPLGSGCRQQESICLSSQETIVTMETIQRLQKRYPGGVKGNAGPISKLKMYQQMELAKKTGVRAKSWSMGFLSACGCAFKSIDILHDGTIVPCCMLPGLKLGNIKSDNLNEIWLEHPVLRALRERVMIPMQSLEECGDCEWAFFCNGGCPAVPFQETGSLHRANTRDCYKKFKMETSTDKDNNAEKIHIQ